jgi:predicted nucleic acid-binding protein
MSAGAAVAAVDAWAALALLRGEGPAAVRMRRYLRQAQSGRRRLLMNVVNLGEVYYRLIQLAGQEKAEQRLRWLRGWPLDIVPAREPLVFEAARLKARHPLSYADAFAVATARLERAAVVTGDPEIVALPRDVVRVVRLPRS